MNENITDVIDPVDLVRNLADQIGIDQLYAVAKDLRGEPDTAVEDALMRQLEELKSHVSYLKEQLARANGTIDGLKFAMRCNGVSGGEVV